MSHLPSPIPPAPGPLPASTPRRRGPIQLGLLSPDLDSESVFASLQLAIARSSAERDVILAAIAEAAQALTDANGAALAIPCDGAVICRARSGEIAPGLGARLSLDSGISGECFRRGRALRCNDAEIDPLVDSEVCRQLGLRSLAIVPLRGRIGPTGILEVFSTRVDAFSEEHMGYLLRLAGLAEVAQERATRTPTASVPISRERIASSKLVSPAARPRRTTVRISWSAFSADKRRYWAMGAAVLLILLAAWHQWGFSSSKSLPSAQAAQPATASPVADLEPTMARSLSLIHSSARTGGMDTSQALRLASRVEITDKPEDPNNVMLAVSSDATGPPDRPDADATSKAVLLRRVQPAYPPEAFRQRLQGKVVLQAAVAEDGSVAGVMVLNGNAILARAAAEAVSQWQYRPFLAEGKPVPTQRRITVTFEALP